MSTPTTTNATATVADTVISDALNAGEQVAEAAAETALDAAVPFFAVPVVKQITDEIIHLALTELTKELSITMQTAGTFVIIDTQVNSESSGLSAALLAVIAADKSGDPNAIAQAIKAYQAAQSALANDDGSATPIT